MAAQLILSEDWMGFTGFEIPTKGHKWVNGRLTKIPTNKSVGPPCLRTEKSSNTQWEEDKPQREAARELRDIIDVPLQDEDYSESSHLKQVETRCIDHLMKKNDFEVTWWIGSCLWTDRRDMRMFSQNWLA